MICTNSKSEDDALSSQESANSMNISNIDTITEENIPSNTETNLEDMSDLNSTSSSANTHFYNSNLGPVMNMMSESQKGDESKPNIIDNEIGNEESENKYEIHGMVDSGSGLNDFKDKKNDFSEYRRKNKENSTNLFGDVNNHCNKTSDGPNQLTKVSASSIPESKPTNNILQETEENDNKDEENKTMNFATIDTLNETLSDNISNTPKFISNPRYSTRPRDTKKSESEIIEGQKNKDSSFSWHKTGSYAMGFLNKDYKEKFKRCNSEDDMKDIGNDEENIYVRSSKASMKKSRPSSKKRIRFQDEDMNIHFPNELKREKEHTTDSLVEDPFKTEGKYQSNTLSQGLNTPQEKFAVENPTSTSQNPNRIIIETDVKVQRRRNSLLRPIVNRTPISQNAKISEILNQSVKRRFDKFLRARSSRKDTNIITQDTANSNSV